MYQIEFYKIEKTSIVCEMYNTYYLYYDLQLLMSRAAEHPLCKFKNLTAIAWTLKWRMATAKWLAWRWAEKNRHSRSYNYKDLPGWLQFDYTIHFLYNERLCMVYLSLYQEFKEEVETASQTSFRCVSTGSKPPNISKSLPTQWPIML